MLVISEDYNFKNKEGKVKYKIHTSETNMIATPIEDKGDIDKVIERFLKKLNECISESFDKRRVKVNKSLR